MQVVSPTLTPSLNGTHSAATSVPSDLVLHHVLRSQNVSLCDVDDRAHRAEIPPSASRAPGRGCGRCPNACRP